MNTHTSITYLNFHHISSTLHAKTKQHSSSSILQNRYLHSPAKHQRTQRYEVWTRNNHLPFPNELRLYERGKSKTSIRNRNVSDIIIVGCIGSWKRKWIIAYAMRRWRYCRVRFKKRKSRPWSIGRCLRVRGKTIMS